MLGVRFFTGTLEEALAQAHAGGLILAPSGPGLAELDRAPDYREALREAEVNLLDSGLLVKLWRLRSGQRLTKLSGYLFLDGLLREPALRVPGATAWVMPTPASAERTRAWLARRHGIQLDPAELWVAPRYPADGALDDDALASWVRKRQPRYVIICLGGGVQERLGWGLRRQFGAGERPPAIVCTGAAIAFMTGEQAPIPWWADRLTLGWLVRCLRAPRSFLPRYWRSLRLIPLAWKSLAVPGK